WLLDNEIGGMISRGVLSGITGMGADLMIIDDPIKNREEADSETHRGKIWDEWIDSFSTRLHPGAIVILILTTYPVNHLRAILL
ncbi:terminase large subunit domain-containing protein, partial [Bacillus sp. D-CC]